MIDIYPIQKKQTTRKPLISSSILLKYLIGITVLILAVYFSLGYINQAIDSWLKLEPIKTESTTKDFADKKPTAAEARLPESLTTQTEPETEVKTEPVSNQPTTSDAETKTEEIDKSAIKIKVLNGNAIWGAAAKAKELLESNGFKVSATGNADNQNYAQTTIYYKTNKNVEAAVVKAIFDQNASGAILEENNAIAADTDLTVVIGKN